MGDSREQKKEDLLLDLYKIHAYIPNDAQGNPLTPFGNFCEGYKVFEDAQAKIMVSLEVHVENLQAKIDALKSQLSIAVDALEQIKESVSEHWSAVYADEALTKINALKGQP